MENLYEILANLLKSDDRFVSSEGSLMRNKVYEAAGNLDEKLLHLLLSNNTTKKRFFQRVDDVWVFDKTRFGWVINNRQFLPDSYTRFKNRIGLVDEKGDYLSACGDVELAFPYKDCLLEMDSTDDRQNRKETFFNEALLPNEIDKLLAPKLFTNASKYVENQTYKLNDMNPIKDSLLIKGNNLFALYSLLPVYRGKIKLMYWDILYNSDNDLVPYNDSFKHSSWLVMMKNRLEVARELLKSNGLIFLQCDDREMAYLKVLCDEIFGRETGYINTITVKTKLAGVSGSSEGKSLIDATEFILVYAKNKAEIKFKAVETGKPLMNVINEYAASHRSWKYTTVLVDKGQRQLIREDNENGYKYYAYSGIQTMSIKQFCQMKGISESEAYQQYYDRIYRTTNAQSSVRATVKKETENLPFKFVGLEYIPKKGRNAGKQIEVLYVGNTRAMVTFLADQIILDNDGMPLYRDRISTLWTDIDYNNLIKEGGVELPFGKKPEKLVSRIIDLVANKGDIVLDAYLGTGTTAAVALKKGLRFIGIEQLDQHVNKSLRRLQNVINGDQTGISREVNWQGGGSFVYCELAELNQKFVRKIEAAQDEETLETIWKAIKHTGFISYKVRPSEVEAHAEDFKALSLEDQKRFLMEVLDKNMLYVNLSDMEDADFGISDTDKAFNKSFYGEV